MTPFTVSHNPAVFPNTTTTYHRKSTRQQNILLLHLLTLFRCLGYLQRDLHATPPRRKRHLSAQFKVANRGQWPPERDPVYRRRDRHDRLASMPVRDHARQGIEVHKDGTEPDMARGVDVGVQQPRVTCQR